jgi:hypothetical protein
MGHSSYPHHWLAMGIFLFLYIFRTLQKYTSLVMFCKMPFETAVGTPTHLRVL